MISQTRKPAVCSACHANFEFDWKELAKHIAGKKDKAHRPSKKWAANYLCRTRELNAKKDVPARAQLTDQEKENKKSVYQELSGEFDAVKTICPNCKRTGSSYLPIEFTQSEFAWRLNGILVFLCNTCRG